MAQVRSDHKTELIWTIYYICETGAKTVHSSKCMYVRLVILKSICIRETSAGQTPAVLKWGGGVQSAHWGTLTLGPV